MVVREITIKCMKYFKTFQMITALGECTRRWHSHIIQEMSFQIAPSFLFL